MPERRAAARIGGTNVHIYQTPFTHESRILKATESLIAHDVFDAIHVVATWRHGLATREQFGTARHVTRIRSPWSPRPGQRLRKLLAAIYWQLAVLFLVRSLRPTCINCHNVWLLPLGVVLKQLTGARLVYDTHELETESVRSVGLRRRVARRIERHAIRHADSVIVVGDLIADWYRRTYGLTNVHVVRNAPATTVDDRHPAVDLKALLGIPADELLYLYQGVLDYERNIHLLINSFRGADAPGHILFMGFGPLEGEVQQVAEAEPRIHFRPAVRPSEVAAYAAGADIGIQIPKDSCLSYRYSLPNKFFEYLANGVPVLVNDLPEMARIVRAHDCGWIVSTEPSELVAFLRRMTWADVHAKRERLADLRPQFLWSREEGELLAAYCWPAAPARG